MIFKTIDFWYNSYRYSWRAIEKRVIKQLEYRAEKREYYTRELLLEDVPKILKDADLPTVPDQILATINDDWEMLLAEYPHFSGKRKKWDNLYELLYQTIADECHYIIVSWWLDNCTEMIQVEQE